MSTWDAVPDILKFRNKAMGKPVYEKEPGSAAWTLYAELVCAECGAEMEIEDHVYSGRERGMLCETCIEPLCIELMENQYREMRTLEQMKQHVRIFDDWRQDRHDYLLRQQESCWGRAYLGGRISEK